MTDKGYTTSAKMANFLNTTITADVSAFILATQMYIDSFTGRNFKADTQASVRLFNGNGMSEMEIDDCTVITKVEVGNDSYGTSFIEVASSGPDRYITLPNNNTANFVPIRKLHLTARAFTFGLQNVKVTAKWGWSTDVPDDIAFCATVLASGMYSANRNSGKEIASESIGQYSVSYSSKAEVDDYLEAKTILNRYRKINL